MSSAPVSVLRCLFLLHAMCLVDQQLHFSPVCFLPFFIRLLLELNFVIVKKATATSFSGGSGGHTNNAEQSFSGKLKTLNFQLVGGLF